MRVVWRGLTASFFTRTNARTLPVLVCVRWMRFPIFPPVVRVSLQPRCLGARLVVLVVRIGGSARLLPKALALALTCGFSAVALIGHLRLNPEELAAGDASPTSGHSGALGRVAAMGGAQDPARSPTISTDIASVRHETSAQQYMGALTPSTTRKEAPRSACMRLIGRAAAVTASVVFSAAAQAWGADAHRLVAQLAQTQLTPAARTEVDRLLAFEAGGTLVSIATWADEVRGRSTAKWHYVDLPGEDCSYVRLRDCADGACVIAAIEAQTSILKSSQSDVVRLRALKFVVHLVADVHQPLHASSHGDKGGGRFQVRAFGRGTNLHALWDSSMVLHRPGGLAKLAVDAQLSPSSASADDSRPAAWAQESCRIANSPGFYPGERLIDQAYVDQWDATLALRLGLAARRLSGLLNASLDR